MIGPLTAGNKRTLSKYRARLNTMKKAPLNERQRQDVKRLIRVNQELKYFDFHIASTNILVAGNLYAMNAIPQGTGDSARDGDRLKMTKLIVNLSLLVGDTYNTVRVMMFQWKPNDTVPPTIASVLLGGLSASVVDPWSLYSHDNRQLFKVIFDKRYSLTGDGTTNYPITTSSLQHIYQRRVFIPSNKQMQFTAGGTTSTNKIYLLVISDSNVVPYPTISGVIRTYFTDS